MTRPGAFEGWILVLRSAPVCTSCPPKLSTSKRQIVEVFQMASTMELSWFVPGASVRGTSTPG
jgi:hypothetical protein